MEHSVEVIWTFIVDYAKDWGVRRHFHDYFQMYCCISGEGTMHLNGRNVPLRQTECLLIWPNQVHELYPIKSGQLRVIDTKFYIKDEALKASVLQSPQLITVENAHFREIQQTMRSEWVTGALYAKEMATLLFEQSLLLFLRNNVQITTQPPFYRTLQARTAELTGLEKSLADYLSVHFLEDLTLDHIADDLRYSKTYLCKIFKRNSSFTINEYINYLRISKAYDMVCYTNNKLTEIAAQCGFTSIHYFSRTFRRIVGITPTQARDQEQNTLYTDQRLHGTFHYRYYCPGGITVPPELSDSEAKESR